MASDGVRPDAVEPANKLRLACRWTEIAMSCSRPESDPRFGNRRSSGTCDGSAVIATAGIGWASVMAVSDGVRGPVHGRSEVDRRASDLERSPRRKRDRARECRCDRSHRRPAAVEPSASWPSVLERSASSTRPASSIARCQTCRASVPEMVLSLPGLAGTTQFVFEMKPRADGAKRPRRSRHPRTLTELLSAPERRSGR